MRLYSADGVYLLIGKKAPDFTLKDVNGKEFKLSDFKGKVILLSFFGSWSQLSRQQIPHLKKLHKQYHKSGLVLLGITVEKNRERLRQFALKNGLPYPVLMGDRKIFKAYKVGGMPDIYYIDASCKVSARDVGLKKGSEKKMEEKIKNLLKMVKRDVKKMRKHPK